VRFHRGQRRVEATIDLTAMLDVTFNLLLFFVVSTSFVKDKEAQQDSPGIEVDLPQSSARQVLEADRELDVWVAADGAVYLDQTPTDQAGLQSAFETRAKTDPNTLVIIKADEGVSHGRVVAIMDLAKSKGLSRMAIATRTGEAP
jgi:biopolymer transport protein ExbD